MEEKRNSSYYDPLLANRARGGEHSAGTMSDVPAHTTTNYQAITSSTKGAPPQSIGSHSSGGGRLRRGHSYLESMEHQPVTLSWENINVFVREKKKKKKDHASKVEEGGGGEGGGGGLSVKVDTASGEVLMKNGGIAAKYSAKNGVKQILNEVTGVIQPGTLMAVMGASGAGKSTLMNVLTSRNLKDYILEGEVKVNGVAIGSGIKHISAYVQQDDLFFSTLTVRETLTFRALLRMDNRIGKKDRLKRVDEVLQEMGLTKCENTQVGKTGAKKGISGGEAKRLSFACELLTNPPLLFCDEPTSGLDTFMAQNIVSSLQAMAQKNRTILCTIHQPSSEIFAMFDRLLLMSEGRVAFMGPSSEAVEYFKGLNYSCPSNFNPADFYILTLAIVPGREDECKNKVKAICDSFKGTRQAKEIKDHIKEENETSRRDTDLMDEAFSSDSRYEASWGRQFATVLWRSWISLIRDVFLFRVRVLQTIIVGVVLGLIYLRLDLNQKGVQNISGALFVLITNASFVNMFAVVNSFPHELPIFLREYGTGMYRTDIYFLAKSIAEIPTFLLFPFLFMAIDYWMMGLYEDGKAFLIAAAIIILVSNVSVSFGMLMSTLAGDTNIALAVAPPIMIPFMMFGGFFLNSDSVPPYFLWLEYVSWFKYSNELLAVNQWENIDTISPCAANATEPSAGCQYPNGPAVLAWQGYSADNTYFNVGMLFVLLIGFRILSFIFLVIRARRSKN